MKTNKACGQHCIRIENLSVKVGEVQIIEDVNLHLHCGRLMVILGKNGAGKSTLLKAILGEIPHSGQLSFSHTNEMSRKMKIGYVPQNLVVERNAPVSVYDLIAGYQSVRPVFLWKQKSMYQKILKQLQLFGAETLIDKQVGKLSGGELQRVLLALATMDEPDLLVLDEPVTGIDKKGTDQFYQIISELKLHYDMGIILVSHDLDYTAAYADEVVLLDHRILRQGSPKAVYESDEFKERFGDFGYTFREEEGEEICCSQSTN